MAGRIPGRTDTGITARLIRIRKETGLSQADFGKQLGLSDRAYKNYELGIRELPLPIFKAIVEIYDINTDWLLFGDEGRSNSK